MADKKGILKERKVCVIGLRSMLCESSQMNNVDSHSAPNCQTLPHVDKLLAIADVEILASGNHGHA